MFLKTIQKRNPALIEACISLHQSGSIPPNCYVIDLDTVMENARQIRASAERYGLSLYYITKQMGFNPLFAACVQQAGIQKAVAVDYHEALTLSQNGISIGHLGHLVQLPKALITRLLDVKPEAITVYSLENARLISAAAKSLGVQVSILLRVVDDHDFFYPGQTGGFHISQLANDASEILRLPNLRITGVTSFPCVLFDENTGTAHATQNFHTILKAAHLLESTLRINITQINAPGNTSAGTMQLLASMGATHGEPGHALTGTTPLHAYSDEPEIPALAYVSEVSHQFGDEICVYGGGLYRRSTIRKALVIPQNCQAIECNVKPFDASAIDYYLSLEKPAGSEIHTGDTVIWSSRTQIFVTRSYVAVVEGIQRGKPVLAGIYDDSGKRAEELFPMGSIDQPGAGL